MKKRILSLVILLLGTLFMTGCHKVKIPEEFMEFYKKQLTIDYSTIAVTFAGYELKNNKTYEYEAVIENDAESGDYSISMNFNGQVMEATKKGDYIYNISKEGMTYRKVNEVTRDNWFGSGFVNLFGANETGLQKYIKEIEYKKVDGGNFYELELTADGIDWLHGCLLLDDMFGLTTEIHDNNGDLAIGILTDENNVMDTVLFSSRAANFEVACSLKIDKLGDVDVELTGNVEDYVEYKDKAQKIEDEIEEIKNGNE